MNISPSVTKVQTQDERKHVAEYKRGYFVLHLEVSSVPRKHC